jgi:hypothetical protein
MMKTADPTALGTTTDTPTVAALLGCSRGAVWAAARDEGGIVLDGEVLRPIRVGRVLRWPTAPILRALGLDGSSPGSDDGLAVPSPGEADEVASRA